MNEKVIIRSSARDLHGLQTGIDLLSKAIESVNGTHKMRQLANHRRDYPPTGYLDNGFLTTENDLDLAVAEVVEYSPSQPVLWDDSLEMQTLSNKIKFKQRTLDSKNLIVTLDPNNYSSRENFVKTLDKINDEVTEPLKFITDTRKGYELNNRVIIYVGLYHAVIHPFVAPFLKKIGEKIAEDIAGDVYSAAKKRLKTAYEDIRKILTITTRGEKVSKNPTELVFEMEGTPKIELHAKLENVDNVVKSLSPARLSKVYNRINELQQHVIIAEAHFSLNQKGQWYFTYLITDDGTVIGTKSIIKKRDQLVKRINLSPTKGYSIGADVTYSDLEDKL